MLVGSPRGSGVRFAEAFLSLLFCESAEKPCGVCASCRRVETHTHVDTLWIEPQSKSRQIKAEDIRQLIHRMTQTSFEGGWKAAVLLSADCLNTASANVLLKTLEEPPPKTILLLVTDSPQALLPTILSRCQKIVLSAGPAAGSDAVWNAPLMALLRELPPSGGLDAARLASRLKRLFDAVKEEIGDAVAEDFGDSEEALDETKLKEILEARTNARLKEVQSEVSRIMVDWHRDVLLLASGVAASHLAFGAEQETLAAQAKLQTTGSALKAIRLIEEMVPRLGRNIPDVQVFDEAFRKLVR